MEKEKSRYNVALLVHACDRYEFLFKGFDIFFNQFWERSIQANFYFATECKQVEISPFINILSKKGEWSDRLIKILSDEIKE